MRDFERRYVSDAVEMRGLPGGGAVLVGHAAVFNREAVIAGVFRELVCPGAFKKTIAEADIRALFNHDANLILGRNRAGTLRLAEDDTGLPYEVDLPDTRAALDLAKSIERGDVSGSSFSFAPVGENRTWWEYPEEDDALPLRSLRELRLFDVSPVTFPAYEETDVDLKRALRSLAIDLSRPVDDLLAAVRTGHLLDSTTEEPEEGPSEPHPEPTSPPDWQLKARKQLELAEFKPL